MSTTIPGSLDARAQSVVVDDTTHPDPDGARAGPCSLAMRDTWLFERCSIPRLCTSPSTRRVDTPRT
jgi:hypothetical protein